MVELVAILSLVAAAPGPAAQAPPPAALPRHCRGHAHSPAQAKRGLRATLKRPYPRSRATGRQKRHYSRCTTAPRRMRRFAHTLERRRRSYPLRWRIRHNGMSVWDQAWAHRTSWCESRGNRNAVGGGGLYYSYFQWLPSTWYAAGGDRWPTLASYHHQAVLAVRWRNIAGATQWPVCGV